MSILFAFLAALLLEAPDVLVFKELSHDFGSQPKSVNILEWDFTFTNSSDKPVKVSYAVSTCSCTKLEWTSSPVAPGESGSVKARYFREQSRSSFEKFISVFVEGVTKPYVLRIAGSFYDTVSSLRSEYPVERDGLGLVREVLEAGTLHPGELKVSGIWLANFTDKQLDLSFEHLSDSLSISSGGALIPALEQKEFRYSIVADSLVWGERLYFFTPVVNGRSVGPVAIRATVVPDFSYLSPEEIGQGPVPVLEGRYCDFGTVGKGKPAVATFNILNKSGKPLVIKRAYADYASVIIDAPASIPPGGTGLFKFTAPPAVLSKGANSFVVTIVSNSPSVPVKKVVVNGKVEY